MTEKQKALAGVGLLILAAILVSFGFGFVCGVAGSCIAGGVVAAIYGAVLLGD